MIVPSRVSGGRGHQARSATANVAQVHYSTRSTGANDIGILDTSPLRLDRPAAFTAYRWEAARKHPAERLHWYDGGILPERPLEVEAGRRLPTSGTIFVGEKGRLMREGRAAMKAFTSGRSLHGASRRAAECLYTDGNI